MEKIYKYPRTRHIEGSRLQKGDEDLKSVKFDYIYYLSRILTIENMWDKVG